MQHERTRVAHPVDGFRKSARVAGVAAVHADDDVARRYAVAVEQTSALNGGYFVAVQRTVAQLRFQLDFGYQTLGMGDELVEVAGGKLYRGGRFLGVRRG
jgi:hypothetical protein